MRCRAPWVVEVVAMSRQQKEPLRAMTEEEEAWLQRIARATREPANHVIRAKQLVAVAAGQSYSQAARLTGRRSGDAVAQLGRRFNREGIPALEARGGGGAEPPARAGWHSDVVLAGAPTSLTQECSAALGAHQYLHNVGGVP